jgi:hypothetical protein
MDRIQELQRKIDILTRHNATVSVIERYRKELEELTGAVHIKEQTKEEVSMAGFGDDGFTLDATQEEFEKAGSKFATPGLHLSEAGMPEWETPGKSIRFPFTIIEDGIDNSKESKIVCGVSKEALFKLKEFLAAVGVPTKTTADGRIAFDHMAVVGKQFMSLWTKQKDSRPVEEGGKGTEFTKPTAAYPVGTKEEDLGI